MKLKKGSVLYAAVYKLSHHFEKEHPGRKNKSEEYLKRLESSCEREQLNATRSFQQSDRKSTEASFFVSQIKAQQKKLYNIEETVIKPFAPAMARTVLSEKYEKSLREIPLSNNTVKRRNTLMSEDIKDQVINKIQYKSVFSLFAIQLDECVHVSLVSQLMVLVRYVVSEFIKKKLLFCSALDTTTKASDVKNLCAVCTDGVSAMLRSKSGF